MSFKFNQKNAVAVAMAIERASGWVLKALWWVFRKLLWQPFWLLCEALWEGLKSSLGDVRKVVITFLTKALLLTLMVALLMVFVQSGFSVSRTFSRDGLEVLIRTFK